MNPNETKFDSLLTAALEHKPEIAVPAHFAARVAASLPAQYTVRVTHYGRAIAWLCVLLLTAGIALLPILRPASLLAVDSTASLLEIASALVLMLLFLFSDIWQTY